MSAYPEARRVELTLADLRRLTVLERARACAIAGIAETEIRRLLIAVSTHQGEPEELERAVLLLYAMALQLERRIDPAISWEDAQRLDLALDLREETTDPEAEAEAFASVQAALGTGLSPSDAGDLTLAQLDAYRVVRAEAEGRAPRARARRARVHR